MQRQGTKPLDSGTEPETARWVAEAAQSKRKFRWSFLRKTSLEYELARLDREIAGLESLLAQKRARREAILSVLGRPQALQKQSGKPAS
jgi:hypothetical protein